MSRDLERPLKRAGYPVALEGIAALLVVAQLIFSLIALDQLPNTVVPYFSPGRSALGLPGAEYEARVWSWTIIGLWAMLLGASLISYRSLRSTPVPVVSVGLFAALAVLRAGVIALNLNPLLSPRLVLLRALATGAAAALLAAAVERFRTRKRLVPALVARASYDEPTPRGAVFTLVAVLGAFIPLVLVPSRVRVTERAVVVITPVSFFLLPLVTIESAERVGPLQALFGAGINLASHPRRAVRLRRRGALSVVVSVTDPDRFLEALERARTTD